MDLHSTIKKLVAIGVHIPDELQAPEAINKYDKMFADKRANLVRHWEQWRKHLPFDDIKELRDLQQKLGINLGMDKQQWYDGPGRFVGGASKR